MSAHPGYDPEFNDSVPTTKTRHGFSFFRVLSAVVILVLLAALLFPASRSARPAARRAQCVNNLKQIGLALHNYINVYKSLPPAYTVDASGRPLHSWRTLILPYLDEQELYQSIDHTKPWNDPANAKAFESHNFVYSCPEMSGNSNKTTYLAIVGPNACFLPDKARRLEEITDAHGSTLMVIEADDTHAVPWMAPTDADEALLLSLGADGTPNHAGGRNAVFVDGSVRFLGVCTSPKIHRSVISISGNDNVEVKDP